MEWIKVSDRLPELNGSVAKAKTSGRLLINIPEYDEDSVSFGDYRYHPHIGNFWVDEHTESIVTVSHWAIITPPTEGE